MTATPPPAQPTPEDPSPGKTAGPVEAEIVPGIRIAIATLAAILFVEILVFTDAVAAWALATAGLVVLAMAALRPRAWTVLAGAGSMGLATAGIPLPSYLSLQAGLFTLAMGLPYLLLVLTAGRLDPQAPPRPQLPGRVVAKRFAPLVGLILLVLFVPGLFAPVRQAWTSDMAGLLSVLLLTGTVIAFLAPLLVDRATEPERVDARSLQRGRERPRFDVVQRRQAPSGDARR